MIRLYSIAEDPYDDGQGPGVWIAVWACRNDEALEYAYKATGTRELHLVGDPITIPGEPRDDLPIPISDRRPEILRLLGWHYDDELYCQSCDLAAMGLPHHAVCPDCEECPTCAREQWAEDWCHCVVRKEAGGAA